MRKLNASKETAGLPEITIDERLDLRGVLCPMNFVKTKLKLETMSSGQILELTLDEGEAMQNVPRSLREDGHEILSIARLDSKAYRLLIRCGED